MRPQLPQLIPSETCLECPVCCRFPDKQAPLSPFFFPEERAGADASSAPGSFRNAAPGAPSKAALVPCGHGYACSFFNEKDHSCRVYSERPLDCSMYPAVVLHSADRRKVLLGADTLCPALARPQVAAKLRQYLDRIQRYLESIPLRSLLQEHPGFIGDYREGIVEMRELSLGKA